MPEETENFFRVPVPAEEGKHEGHRIRTIDISVKDGIKALYCGEHKVVITYLFSTDDKFDWTMDKAEAWVKEKTTPAEKTSKSKGEGDRTMELAEFFTGLTKTLQGAVDGMPAAGEPANKMSDEEVAAAEKAKTDNLEAAKKAIEGVIKSLDLTVVEGKEDEASELAKFVKSTTEDMTTLREVCTKLLERVEGLEKHTAVRKSLAGQEGGGENEDKPSGMDTIVKTLMTKGKVKLT